MLNYDYEEVKELWDFAGKRVGLIDKEEHVHYIVKRFHLVKKKHYDYLSEYYYRYVKER